MSASQPASCSTLLSRIKASSVPHRIATLIFVRTPSKVLLGMKKRGFGEGKLNGYGGKLEESDASIAHSAARELKEESGLSVEVSRFQAAGVLYFQFDPKTTLAKVDGKLLVVHLFVVEYAEEDLAKLSHEVIETEEMRPKWYPVESIPFDGMWIDDPLWLPLVMQGKKVEAAFDFLGFDKILEKQVTVVGNL